MPLTKTRFAAGAAASLALLLAAVSYAAMPSVKNNELRFSFPDLQGNTVTEKDARFKGKVVIVDVWGTWCPPCIKMIPLLAELQEKHRGEGLEVVGIAFEGGDEKRDIPALKNFAKKNKINYTVLYGGAQDDVEKSLPDIVDWAGFPTALFIGRDGKVRETHLGFTPETPKHFEKLVQELLAEK